MPPENIRKPLIFLSFQGVLNEVSGMKWIKTDISITQSNSINWFLSQPAFTCSKLAIETLEQGVKYVQS